LILGVAMTNSSQHHLLLTGIAGLVAQFLAPDALLIVFKDLALRSFFSKKSFNLQAAHNGP
jgi:hypothetical protein